MFTRPLTEESLDPFIDYCKQHRDEVDESFLYDEDFEVLPDDKVHPTYLLYDGENKLVGAVSLMLDDYFIRGKRARFRIFHSTVKTVDAYKLLFDAIVPHTEAIDRVFLFAPKEQIESRNRLDELGFEIERFSYVLDRQDVPVPDAVFPVGYSLKPFRFGEDEEKWCEVRNEAFAVVKGSETPLTPQEVSKMRDEGGFLENGLQVLYDEAGKPVGLLRVTIEDHKGADHAFIHFLAVKPDRQKRGLGRNLLRSGLHIGREHGLLKALITVNAENEKAVNLYLAEGFKPYETLICYNYDLFAQ